MEITILSPGIYTYGAMLIGGVLRDAGHRVTLTRTPEVPMGSILLMQHLLDPAIRDVIRAHRERGGRVYVGGPVSAAPEMVLGEIAPDAVVVGEGEETVVRLVEEGVSPDLPGIAFLDDGRTVVTPPAPPAPIERPLPLIPDDIGSQSIRGASAYIETHRGCIGGCTFCQVPRFFGRRVRSRSIESIIEEVKAFAAHGAKRLSISGGTGSLYGSSSGEMNPDAFIDLLRGMAEVMGPKNISAPDIRVDCITDEILDAIKRYTIGWVFFDLIATLLLDDTFVSAAEPIPGTPLADLVVKTPRHKNPTFMPHKSDYRALGLTESEARCLDLMIHADLFRKRIRIVNDEIFDAYLAEVRKQGKEIRAATDLILRYAGV